jgi:hypothetical protein
MSSNSQPELLVECHQLYLAFVETQTTIFRRLFTECAYDCGIEESNIQLLCLWYDDYSTDQNNNHSDYQEFFSSGNPTQVNTSLSSSGYSTELFVGSHIIGL